MSSNSRSYFPDIIIAKILRKTTKKIHFFNENQENIRKKFSSDIENRKNGYYGQNCPFECPVEKDTSSCIIC